MIWGVLVLWKLIGIWVGRNLGFVIWGFGVVEVGRERLNLGDCFCWWSFENGGELWIGCRLIAAFQMASNHPI